MTRETSLEAYSHLVKNGLISHRHLLAWVTLQINGPLTGRELDKAAETVGLWKRLSELKALGLVREKGVRRCSISERSAIVWEHVAAQPSGPSKPYAKPAYYLAITATGLIISANRDRGATELVCRLKDAELVKVREVKRLEVKR